MPAEFTTRTIPALTGPYEVTAPRWFPDECCASAIRLLEEAGALPCRNVGRPKDGSGLLGLQFGGGQVKFGPHLFDVRVWEKMVRIEKIPDDQGPT